MTRHHRRTPIALVLQALTLAFAVTAGAGPVTEPRDARLAHHAPGGETDCGMDKIQKPTRPHSAQQA